ncbi:MAG: aminodeoxychorismate synthase component I [Thiohalomonadales bacterium]|nr:aminodeoxychorismate synthase component I [Thiohalomonadales bacterium]
MNTHLVRHDGLSDLLSLQREQPDEFPFLLQSAVADAGEHEAARYDILFAFPSDSLQLTADGRVLLDGIETESADFLRQLDRVWQQAAQHHRSLQTEVPFWGGWFLYLGYELAGQIEPRFQLPKPDSTMPVAAATRIPAAIINDHTMRQTILVAETAELLAELELILETPLRSGPVAIPPAVAMQADLPKTYLDQVARVKHYIVEGDVFQVNLSRAWRGSRPPYMAPADIYARLCQTNPAPFAGLATFPQGAIISSSPERLLRVKAGWAETRPIAGTRPRSQSEPDDMALKTELIRHPKERAEHIMLIDLERNDLGRVCKPGSVEVNEMMVLESYAHVHHIVSNVRGELEDDVTPGQAIRAVFPGGTITGCPKERCMAIIGELEQTARGAYTGSMGYLNHNGDMDLNILIRTITMDNDTISLRAGAGLVADSVAEQELEETCHKARGMLLALGAET